MSHRPLARVPRAARGGPARLSRGRQARRSRGGFTLLELLVVVALLAVLSSLVVLGVGKLQLNAKKQQTILIMHNLQSMFADYDAVAHPKFPNIPLPCPGLVTTDNSTNGMGGLSGTNNDRYRGTVQLTRSLFATMRSVPTVRSSFDKLPPQNTATDTITPGYAVNPWTPATTYDYTSQDATKQYATVDDGHGGYAVYLYVGPAAAGNRPPDPRFWYPYTSDATARLVTDAWGNPILACFGGALGTAHNPQVAASARVVGDNNLYVAGLSNVVTSPDGRPFFASAGPDGDFGAGDDNLYSFEH